MNDKQIPNAVFVKLMLGECTHALRVPEGTLSATVSERLPPQWRDHVIVVVNGRIASPDAPLKKEDRVVIFPKMAGG